MLELATFLSSYVLSFISTIISKRSEQQAKQHERLLQLAGLREQSTQAARTQTDSFSKLTRRVLALSVGALLLAVTLGLGNAWLGQPIFVELTEKTQGFWPFLDATEHTYFTQLHGAVLLQEYRLVLLSVFGLYFGNNHAR